MFEIALAKQHKIVPIKKRDLEHKEKMTRNLIFEVSLWISNYLGESLNTNKNEQKRSPTLQ